MTSADDRARGARRRDDEARSVGLLDRPGVGERRAAPARSREVLGSDGRGAVDDVRQTRGGSDVVRRGGPGRRDVAVPRVGHGSRCRRTAAGVVSLGFDVSAVRRARRRRRRPRPRRALRRARVTERRADGLFFPLLHENAKHAVSAPTPIQEHLIMSESPSTLTRYSVAVGRTGKTPAAPADRSTRFVESR